MWQKQAPNLSAWYWHREGPGKQPQVLFVNSGLIWNHKTENWDSASKAGGEWWSESIDYPPGS